MPWWWPFKRWPWVRARTRDPVQCAGRFLGHRWHYVPPEPWEPHGNLVCSGQPSYVFCERCGRARPLGMKRELARCIRVVRTFTDGGPPLLHGEPVGLNGDGVAVRWNA